MAAILKGLGLLVVLGLVGFVGFALLGPLFGADFSAPQRDISIPVDLDDI